MIRRDDILSMEYLKKAEFTGSHQGMRYRLEGVEVEGEKQLKVTIWPEPFNFYTTPEEQKTCRLFPFDEDGVSDGVAWMNDCLFAEKERWEQAPQQWDNYSALLNTHSR